MLPLLSFTALVASLASVATARDVFVHYMAQTLNEDHAAQDVQKALSLGISAFALNVGEPDAEWCQSAIKQLFDAADGTDFKIFFSLDLYARPDPYAFSALIEKYASHPSYYLAGPRSAPFLSTFSDAGWGVDKWATFLESLGTKPHFVPMFDQAAGYYTDPEAFWQAWGPVLDGSFSWEQSWPSTSDVHKNVTSAVDQQLMAVNHARDKDYMMGLSSLQYKHFLGQHWFRSGDVVLPERMAQILALPTKPEYVQVQTWNDAGESHYIGELWAEGHPPEIRAYANEMEHTHQGWQPLIASFITAFRDGVSDASGMRPQEGKPFIGSIWHHEFLTRNSRCENDELGAPKGHGAALDSLNWAIVMADDIGEHSLRVWSGGEVVAKGLLFPGLNYNAVPDMLAGEQIIQIINEESGTVVAQSERSTRNVTEEAWGNCNFNFQVAPLLLVEDLLPAETASSTPLPTSALDKVSLAPRPLSPRPLTPVSLNAREAETHVVHATVVATVTAPVENVVKTVTAPVENVIVTVVASVSAPVPEPTTTVKATSRSTFTVTIHAAAHASSVVVLEETTKQIRTTFATKIVTVVDPGKDLPSDIPVPPPTVTLPKPEEPKPEEPKPGDGGDKGGSGSGAGFEFHWDLNDLPGSIKAFIRWKFGIAVEE